MPIKKDTITKNYLFFYIWKYSIVTLILKRKDEKETQNYIDHIFCSINGYITLIKNYLSVRIIITGQHQLSSSHTLNARILQVPIFNIC